MKRHLQCAEQAQSASNLTKYCACHEICKFKTSAETPWIASANRKTIRRQSDDNPTTIRRQSDQKIASRTHRFGDLTRPTLNTILYWKIQHFGLRLSPKMSPNAAPATKSHTPTSPNTAPGTQNASHDWSASHMKRHLECAEDAKSTSNLAKYCACHAKWTAWLIRLTHETSFRMRGATRVTLQLHQILRLPRKMNLMIDPRHIWNVIYNARSKHSQPLTSPNIAPATKSVSSSFQRKLRELLPPIERRFEQIRG